MLAIRDRSGICRWESKEQRHLFGSLLFLTKYTHLVFFLNTLIFIFYLLCCMECMYPGMCMSWYKWSMCWGQGTTGESWVFPSTSGSLSSDTGCRVWWQKSLPSEPPHQPWHASLLGVVKKNKYGKENCVRVECVALQAVAALLDDKTQQKRQCKKGFWHLKAAKCIFEKHKHI